MPKYDPNTSSSQATTQTRVLAEWTDKPFVSHRRRHKPVDHRIVLDHHGRGQVDLRHEVKSDRYDGLSDEWTPAEVWEVRDHGVTKVKTEDAGWFT